ncbi:hypothetical protein V6N12_015609 [Hibiscus sabdariffa]|uniref:pectinesterase n=1 Tax=Hibiscus sabdariffa TaxID=183260 RepID=A0ABR2DP40_9ROSI
MPTSPIFKMPLILLHQTTKFRQYLFMLKPASTNGGDSIKGSTFTSNAYDFVAMDCIFKNTCNLEPGKLSTWAPAALINADKASFYRCGFVSVQDTLTDSEGRHYF